MKAETPLSCAVFQLTPTRTRCELVISAEGESEKLASGLLNPFLTHLKTAEEQIAKGGYSIRLEPPSGTNQNVSWFTKGTMERFVRFVSTPEVLERVNTVESEITQIEEAISIQCSEPLAAEDQLPKFCAGEQNEACRPIVDVNPENAIVPFKPRRHMPDGNETVQGENSKARLLKVLETRKMVLQKEQGMAFARAAAAGFNMDHMGDLVSFAECFGALRLREACMKFMDLWKKKQEAGLWLEEMELETMEASSTRSDMSFMNASGIMLSATSALGRHLRPKYSPDTSSDLHSELGDSKVCSSHDGISNNGKLNGTEAVRDANEEYVSPNANRDNRLSMENQVPVGLMGNNEYLQGHFQQPLMPPWPGQPSQYMQGFQSHPVGPGLPMQGLHGFPMQGMPYYQGYPGNPPFFQSAYPQQEDHPGLAVPPLQSLSHWQRYSEDSRFGTAQRADPHGVSNISAGLKHYAMDERDSNVRSETSETGSPKSISRSQDLTDQGAQSELEKDILLGQETRRHIHRRYSSPRRRSSSPRRRVQIGRSGGKRSGMVVIRNINYIASKRHDQTGKAEFSEESDSQTGSDVEDDVKKKAEDARLHVKEVIGIFEKKHKELEEASRQKGGHGRSVSSCNSCQNAGNIGATREDDGREDDGQSWQAFQRYLLQDDESSQNNPENDNAVEQSSKQKIVNDEDVIVVERDSLGSNNQAANNMIRLEQESILQMEKREIGKDSLILPERDNVNADASFQGTSRFEASHGNSVQGYKQITSNEEFLLPQRSDSGRDREDALLDTQSRIEREGSSIRKKPTYDDFIISRQAGQMNSTQANLDPITGDEFEHTINQHADNLHSDKNYGQSLGDDSFMVPARSILQDEGNSEWRTAMNIDSELPSAGMEKISNGLQKNKSQFADSHGPDELYMIPERNSEREPLGLSWNPAMDYDMQVNLTDKKNHVADLNGFVGKNKFLTENKVDCKLKGQPGTKKLEKQVQLKAMQEALEKRKAEMAARNRKLSKSSPLAEAQMRAEKLRAFKASLQKTKKEKEEEERKRLEELKIQRQKRIAARRNSSPTSSTSTSRSAKTQQHKSSSAGKLSPSSLQGRTSNNLSSADSLPSPSVLSNPITRSSTELVNGWRTRKSNISNRSSPVQNVLSRSVPSLSELQKENDGTFTPSRSVGPVSKRLSTIKNSGGENGSSKYGNEGNGLGPSGATSHYTARALGGSLKPKGATLRSRAHALDDSDINKRCSPATGKGIAAVNELKGKSLKGQVNNSLQKAAKNTSTQPVRRGKGTSLVTDVGNVKSKGILEVDVSKKHNNDDVLPAEQTPQANESECLTVPRAELSMEIKELKNGSFSDDGSGKKARVGPGYIPICAPASNNAGDVAAQDPEESLSDSCHVKQMEAIPIRAPPVDLVDEEFDTDDAPRSASVPFSSFAIPDSPNSSQSDVQEDKGNTLQALSSVLDSGKSDQPYRAPFARMTSFDEPSAAPETSSMSHGVFFPRVPVSENYSLVPLASDYSNSSPLLQNMPKLPQSIPRVTDGGKSDASHSRQKLGSAEKHPVKETAKGFKRLLKFGRKSHNSSTSEVNEDAGQLREVGSRIFEDKGGKLEVIKEAGNVRNHTSAFATGTASDNGVVNQGHSLGRLISQDDNSSGSNQHKASRSFFSLSTFRSKGSEAKAR